MNASYRLYRYSGYFTLTSTAVVLSEHLPRTGIQTPDLLALSPKVLPIRPSRRFPSFVKNESKGKDTLMQARIIFLNLFNITMYMVRYLKWSSLDKERQLRSVHITRHKEYIFFQGISCSALWKAKKRSPAPSGRELIIELLSRLLSRILAFFHNKFICDMQKFSHKI